MSTVIQRLKQYIDAKGITIAAFERSVEMSNASFSKSLKSGGSIGSDRLAKILFRYPDLNAEWLMTGRGQMLYPASGGNVRYTLEQYQTPAMHEPGGPDNPQQTEIEYLRQQIQSLNKIIADKNSIIKDKEIIHLLRQHLNQLEKESRAEDYVVTAIYGDEKSR